VGLSYLQSLNEDIFLANPVIVFLLGIIFFLNIQAGGPLRLVGLELQPHD